MTAILPLPTLLSYGRYDSRHDVKSISGRSAQLTRGFLFRFWTDKIKKKFKNQFQQKKVNKTYDVECAANNG